MVCSACNGKGYVSGKDGEHACPECKGRGELLPAFDPAPEQQRHVSGRGLSPRLEMI
jgi:DnaJ-class molecular chaperone